MMYKSANWLYWSIFNLTYSPLCKEETLKSTSLT